MARQNSRRIPKQARSQERFDQVLDTAANLFSERGFEATTTNEIARRAGMSVGALYQYFNNKEAIVEALADQYVETLRGVMADVLAADVRDAPTRVAVDRVLDPIVEFHASHPALHPLWLGAELSQKLRTSMRAMDEELGTRVEELLRARVPGIPADRARVTVRVMALAAKSLMGLVGHTDDPTLRTQAAVEMKRMLVAYVDHVAREHEA
jgi:AcrR family transcriptional regulator